MTNIETKDRTAFTWEFHRNNVDIMGIQWDYTSCWEYIGKAMGIITKQKWLQENPHPPKEKKATVGLQVYNCRLGMARCCVSLNIISYLWFNGVINKLGFRLWSFPIKKWIGWCKETADFCCMKPQDFTENCSKLGDLYTGSYWVFLWVSAQSLMNQVELNYITTLQHNKFSLFQAAFMASGKNLSRTQWLY